MCGLSFQLVRRGHCWRISHRIISQAEEDAEAEEVFMIAFLASSAFLAFFSLSRYGFILVSISISVKRSKIVTSHSVRAH